MRAAITMLIPRVCRAAAALVSEHASRAGTAVTRPLTTRLRDGEDGA